MHAYAVHIIYDVIVKLLDSQQSLRDAEGHTWSATIFFYMYILFFICNIEPACCCSLMAHLFPEYSDPYMYATCNQMA